MQQQPTEHEFVERGRLLEAEIAAHAVTKRELVHALAHARELSDELAASQAVRP
jgi:hypothetical protein